MNWQEELLKKSQELNLKGGETNDSISRRSSSRNDNRSSRNTLSSISTENRENLTNNNDEGKEEEIMITREAALDDLQKLESEATDVSSKIIIKVAVILVKMLATIRSNQLLTDEDKVAIKKARETRKYKEQK